MPDEQQEEKPEWEVIRRAPAPQSSSPGAPVVIGLVVLLGLGLGGYFLTRGGGDDGTQGGNSSPTPSGSVAPDEPAPDYVWEQIDFETEQGSLQSALDAVEAALEDYPNSRELQARRETLRKDLGLGAGPERGRSLSQLKQEAKTRIDGREFEEALELLDEAQEEDPDDAEVYFLRGRCLGELGHQLEAIGELEDAKQLGFDEGQVDQLLRRYRQ